MLVCNLASEVFTSGIVIDTGTASSRVPGEPLFSWEDVACDLPETFCPFNQVSGDWWSWLALLWLPSFIEGQKEKVKSTKFFLSCHVDSTADPSG